MSSTWNSGPPRLSFACDLDAQRTTFPVLSVVALRWRGDDRGVPRTGEQHAHSIAPARQVLTQMRVRGMMWPHHVRLVRSCMMPLSVCRATSHASVDGTSRENVAEMNRRDVYGLIGGVIFALVWMLLTQNPLQAVSTGVIFAVAWSVGRRYSEGKRQRNQSRQR